MTVEAKHHWRDAVRCPPSLLEMAVDDDILERTRLS